MLEIAHVGGVHYVAVGAKEFEELGNDIISAREEVKETAVKEAAAEWEESKSKVIRDDDLVVKEGEEGEEDLGSSEGKVDAEGAEGKVGLEGSEVEVGSEGLEGAEGEEASEGASHMIGESDAIIMAQELHGGHQINAAQIEERASAEDIAGATKRQEDERICSLRVEGRVEESSIMALACAAESVRNSYQTSTGVDCQPSDAPPEDRARLKRKDRESEDMESDVNPRDGDEEEIFVKFLNLPKWTPPEPLNLREGTLLVGKVRGNTRRILGIVRGGKATCSNCQGRWAHVRWASCAKPPFNHAKYTKLW